MSSSFEGRIGTTPNESVKAPCVAATTANITLSGEQTIDGVAVVSGDRVLVKDQTTANENGIYVAASSAWSRAADWNSSGDVVNGILVHDTNRAVIFSTLISGSFIIGSTGVSFTLLPGSSYEDVADAAVARGVTPVVGKTLFIRSADGGGRIWKAVTGAAAGTYTNDGGVYCGTEIIPTGGDGSSAWVDDSSGPVNVKWFGAKGDGVTDDTSTIQSSLNFGGEIYFPEGTYLIDGLAVSDEYSAILDITKQVKLFSDSKNGATIKQKTADNGTPMFIGQDVDGVEISNISLDGSLTAGTYAVAYNYGIKLYGCKYVSIDNCFFSRMSAGVRTGGSSTNFSEKVNITNNIFYDMGTPYISKPGGGNRIIVSENIIDKISVSGIVIDDETWIGTDLGYAEEVIISNNIVNDIDSGRASTNAATGISVQEGYKKAIVIGNVISKIKDTFTGVSGTGILITTSPNQEDKIIENIIVSNNIVDDFQVRGLLIQSGISRCDYISVNNNIVCNSATALVGIDLFGSVTANIKNVSVNSNIIYGLTNSSTKCEGISNEIDEVVENIVINANVVDDVSGVGIYSKSTKAVVSNNLVSATTNGSDGIVIKGDRCTVSSNTIDSCSGAGLKLFNASFCNISSNSCNNNAGQGIYAISSPDNIIQANTCTDDQATKTQTNGIRLDSASGSCRVAMNYCRGNSSLAIYDQSTTMNAGNIITIDSNGNVTA